MATGAAGAVAVAILRHRGFQVTAASGRPEEADYLKSLGASEIIERKEPAKPLEKERWTGGIDAANSTTLANVLSMTRCGGAVAAVDWRAAWICRLRSRRLSCVVLRFSASTQSCVRLPIGERHGNGWRATSIGESLRP